MASSGGPCPAIARACGAMAVATLAAPTTPAGQERDPHGRTSHDSAGHKGALYKGALHDRALHDSALHDSALHDSKLPDLNARRRDARSLSAATGIARLSPSSQRSNLQRVRTALPLPAWAAPAMALGLVLVLVGLLFDFQRVVKQGVAQGALRRHATAAHADSLLQCRLISRREDQRQCLFQLAGP
jgi:hypothetical protein